MSTDDLTPMEQALIFWRRHAEQYPQYRLGFRLWLGVLEARTVEQWLDVRIDENALKCPIDAD